MSENPPPNGKPDGNRPTGPEQPRYIDPPVPPPDLLRRYRARVLEPASVLTRRGETELEPTVYVSDSLLIPDRSWRDLELRRMLDEAAAKRQVEIRQDDSSLLPPEPDPSQRSLEAPYARPVRLVPISEALVAEPDAWATLQQIRADAEGRSRTDLVSGIGLNHLLMGCTGIGIGGVPVSQGHPISQGHGHPGTDGAGLSEYVLPGRGGRTPVTFVGRPPARRDDRELGSRRPVVAILDTGCGRHPWLPTWQSGQQRPPGAVVRLGLEWDGLPAGHTDPDTDSEVGGDLVGPLDGALDSHSGHGTFMAGLIRQLCPDADLIAIRIMGSTGLVPKSDLLRALAVLHDNQLNALKTGSTDGLVDIVVLALGYYHETPKALALDPILLAQLTALGELGVTVVASAGNHATSRKMFPAAFSPHPGGHVQVPSPDVLPVLSVGGLNPDQSVALFSNGGDWVTEFAPGSALVSTFPTTFNGSTSPLVASNQPIDAGKPRRTIDPDSYRGGFGTWSGTSFAAPVLAGRLAQALLDQQAAGRSVPPLDQLDPTAGVHRGWSAWMAVQREWPSPITAPAVMVEP